MVSLNTSSILPLLTTLIGSSFTLFIINHLVADFNQPHIFLREESLSHKNDNNTIITSKIIAINDGRTSATNVRLTVLYSNAKIINYTSPFQNENMTIKQEKPTLLVAKINRLAVGSAIIINTVSTPFLNATNLKPVTTITTTSNNNNNNNNNNNYIISASYDQGSETISNTFSPILDADDTSIIPRRIQIVILFGILSAISFLFALLYRRIKHFKTRLNRPKYFSQIAKNILEIKNVLQSDILSRKIFVFDIWDSKDDSYKHKIFVDYLDYHFINAFYKKLKERHSEFALHENIDEDNIKKHNEECLKLANDILRNIDLKKYHDIDHKRLVFALASLATIFGSLAIFFLLEVFRVYFFAPLIGLPIASHIIYDILTLMLRGVIAFLLAREIINFQLSYASVYDININEEFHIRLPKGTWFKLLVLSFLIMSIPLFSMSREFNLFESTNIDIHILFTFLVVLDVIRMFVLTMIIPKLILRNGHTRHRNVDILKKIVLYRPIGRNFKLTK
jgi:hypothetical protein